MHDRAAAGIKPERQATKFACRYADPPIANFISAKSNNTAPANAAPPAITAVGMLAPPANESTPAAVPMITPTIKINAIYIWPQGSAGRRAGGLLRASHSVGHGFLFRVGAFNSGGTRAPPSDKEPQISVRT
jgi:hypothetical protein